MPDVIPRGASKDDDIAELTCEVCGEPVSIGERHAILRDDGEHWRHEWHLEVP